MVMVYEEMSKLHNTMAPILSIQPHKKERSTLLMEVMITLKSMYEWSIKYPRALTVVPKKDWITIKNSKVQLCIKI